MANVRGLENQRSGNRRHIRLSTGHLPRTGHADERTEWNDGLKSEMASATFNLKEGTFMYGPMQTWPHWPNPPIMEVMALHVLLPRGSWLCIAEDLKPEALPSRMLPL